MAKLKTFVPLDLDDLTFSDFDGAKLVDASKKGFTIDTDGGPTIEVGGSGFQYDKIGGFKVPVSGEVTKISVELADGSPAFRLTGVEIDIDDILKAASTATFDDDLKLIKDALDDDDQFTGSKGDDALFTFGGDDLLNGGRGNDLLDGGDGHDVFQFSSFGRANFDHVVRFGGKDEIELSSATFSELTEDSVGLAKGTFVLGDKATDGDHRIIYDRDSGRLFYDADGDGAGKQQLIAVFDDHSKLGRGDFDLV